MPDQTWLLTGDLHVGSPTGLHPAPRTPGQEALLRMWRECQRWCGKPDVVLINGDAIDGEDRKGRDTIEADILDQCQHAAELIHEWGATSEYIIISGTPYHEDCAGTQMSRAVADKLRVMCLEAGDGAAVTWKRKLNTTINGWFRLQARHQIGRSSVPYGTSTAQAKSKVWQVLNAALTARREVDHVKWPHLLVFSHVHYFNLQADDYGCVVSLPCWQAYGSRYGDEQCDGHCTLGVARLTVPEQEEVETWQLIDTKRFLPRLTQRVEAR